MAEPTTSSVGGLVILKVMNIQTIVSVIGSVCASVVVMCMTPPQSRREMAVCVISTFIASVAGGSWFVHALDLLDFIYHGPFGLSVLLGLSFTCGLPGWAIVRWIFNYINKRNAASIDQIITEALERSRNGGDR